MAHELQVRYSDMVAAKARKLAVLKTGVVFNSKYEGSPKAGAVKIPVRGAEITVSDYDKANGVTATTGATTYETLTITKDVAINEIIDGYDEKAVPDGLVAERLDSGAYVMAMAEDNDGATVLLAEGSVVNETTIDKTNVYEKIVDLRTAMSKDNIPNDNRRFLLAKPDIMSLILKSAEFISASNLGDNVKEDGVVGRIAGFKVIEWNDDTANLAMTAGHPDYATRCREFVVPVKVQNLDGSGKYIGAVAVQGRSAYGHKVTNPKAIKNVYTPGSLSIALAQGATAGTTIATITGNAGTLKYKLNPATRATYDLATATYGGTSLTSGTTEIAVSEGDILEVVDIVSTKVAKVGYITVTAAVIK